MCGCVAPHLLSTNTSSTRLPHTHTTPAPPGQILRDVPFRAVQLPSYEIVKAAYIRRFATDQKGKVEGLASCWCHHVVSSSSLFSLVISLALSHTLLSPTHTPLSLHTYTGVVRALRPLENMGIGTYT